ncbi:hypothetical protein ACI77N_13220 [Pseudomonas sp. S191]|uniref:hypothetical protein n=1 Tax=Pseudomonas sp. S191 TaxID=579575 RepID=UPI00387AE7A7
MKYSFVGPIYRHVTKDSYADQFVTGESIRVSTFQTCRDYEDEEQGDPGEGHMYHLNTHITDDHPRFHELTSQFGMDLRGAEGVVFGNNLRRDVVSDAYVICFSLEVFGEDLRKKFGGYPVRVNDITAFMWPLLRAMNKVVPVHTWLYGPAVYHDRMYLDFDAPPGHICLVKPPFPFKPQREFRLVITCHPGHIYKPFNVSMPYFKSVSRRVP